MGLVVCVCGGGGGGDSTAKINCCTNGDKVGFRYRDSFFSKLIKKRGCCSFVCFFISYHFDT